MARNITYRTMTGADITNRVISGRTKVFSNEEDAKEYAKDKRSYTFKCIKTENSVLTTVAYAVPM